MSIISFLMWNNLHIFSAPWNSCLIHVLESFVEAASCDVLGHKIFLVPVCLDVGSAGEKKEYINYEDQLEETSRIRMLFNKCTTLSELGKHWGCFPVSLQHYQSSRKTSRILFNELMYTVQCNKTTVKENVKDVFQYVYNMIRVTENFKVAFQISLHHDPS